MILGIDVGGTHTDAVLIDHFKVRKKAKVLTNEKNLLSSLLAVTTELVDEEISGKLKRVVLSTTLSTNAIVQNKVDRVGMMVISGPRLHPSCLGVPEDTHFLSGYMNHRGIEISEIDPLEAKRISAHFRAEGIEQVGIFGKFSTRNPQQEIRLKEIIDPGLCHVSLGHRLSGHLNFPRRIATTYLNEAIWKRYSVFVKEVLHFVRERKLGVPIYILKADGGTFDIEQSVEFPVQTIHEMLEGKYVNPRRLYVVGGPAESMATELGRLLGCEPHIPEHSEVANAIGAALARTTAEMTILADTERGILTIAEEGYQTPIPTRFTSEDVIRIGKEKLCEKALRMGAAEEDMEIEAVEVQEFNMVREYCTTGKNIRVKVQIKPGAIAGYKMGNVSC